MDLSSPAPSFAAELAKLALARSCGVRLIPDIHERASACGLVLPAGAKRRARLAAIARAGLLFVHVPKNAGMSISQALYGLQVRHASIRYYLAAVPELVATLPSVAVVRDPVARFVSAYRYARAGGAPDNQISIAFRARYLKLRSIDDALDHVTGVRTPYALDHVFRPQSWYLCDAAGRIAVERLVPFERIDRSDAFAGLLPARALPHLNRARGERLLLTPGQIARVQALYADDLALYRQACAQAATEEAWRVPAPAPAAHPAAAGFVAA